jgi:hypothetical protein
MGRMISHRSGLRTAGAFLLLLAASQALAFSAHALECPVPKPLTRPGVLRETPAQVAGVSNLLATGDVGNRATIIAADLRARYPGVENAELVNYLMAAYCPIVARLPGLSEVEWRARMDAFVSRLARLIYAAAEPAQRARSSQEQS